jgi:hypothetical protein
MRKSQVKINGNCNEIKYFQRNLSPIRNSNVNWTEQSHKESEGFEGGC